MYNYHYNYIKKKFDTKLLFTNKDSLVYETETKKDFYGMFYKDKHLFDFGNFECFMILPI